GWRVVATGVTVGASSSVNEVVGARMVGSGWATGPERLSMVPAAPRMVAWSRELPVWVRAAGARGEVAGWVGPVGPDVMAASPVPCRASLVVRCDGAWIRAGALSSGCRSADVVPTTGDSRAPAAADSAPRVVPGARPWVAEPTAGNRCGIAPAVVDGAARDAPARPNAVVGMELRSDDPAEAVPVRGDRTTELTTGGAALVADPIAALAGLDGLDAPRAVRSRAVPPMEAALIGL